MTKTLAIVLSCWAAAFAQNTQRVIDVEAEMPESLRPIDQEIRRLEEGQRTALEKRGKAIEDLKVRLTRNPGDGNLQAAIHRAEADLATILFDSETRIARQYDQAAVSARELAAAVNPCPPHPPIDQQRDRTRRQLEALLTRAGADRPLAEGGDASAAARLPLIVQEIGEAQTLLQKLNTASEEEGRQCRSLTEEQDALKNYGDRMQLRGDIHLLKAAQMAIQSLVSLIRLSALAEQETLRQANQVMEKFERDRFDVSRELDRVLGRAK